MGTGRGWSVQVEVSPSRRGVEGQPGGSLTAWHSSKAWGGARGSLDVSVEGAALPPLFMPGGSCRVTRSAPPPASPKGRCDRNPLPLPEAQERTTHSPRPSPSQSCITESAPPRAHTRVSPILRPAGGLALLPRNGAEMDHLKGQARPVTPPEKSNSQGLLCTWM